MNETNGHLEAEDLKVKGLDLEWSEHDGTRDDNHIVYLPRFSIVNQSNWQPLSPLLVIFIDLSIYLFIYLLIKLGNQSQVTGSRNLEVWRDLSISSRRISRARSEGNI